MLKHTTVGAKPPPSSPCFRTNTHRVWLNTGVGGGAQALGTVFDASGNTEPECCRLCKTLVRVQALGAVHCPAPVANAVGRRRE